MKFLLKGLTFIFLILSFFADSFCPDSEKINTTLDVKAILDSLTVEEKVMQLFVVTPSSLDASSVTEATPSLLEKINSTHNVGGFIFFANNIVNPDQTKAFTSSLSSSGKIPPVISVDEEGGLVSRIAKNPNMGYTNRKDALYEENPYERGRYIGKMLSDLGFNMNFAPVADVFTNPENKVIGTRSFSSDAKECAQKVVDFIKGQSEFNILSSAKHFPGHGDTKTDTHDGSAFLDHTKERLFEVELLPFKKAIEASCDSVMISHVTLLAIDGENPASFSKPVIDILRDDLSFDKVVITDALNMGAVTSLYPDNAASLKAFMAGCDMLLMPENFNAAYESMLNAVKSGTITEERLNESVERILKMKLKLISQKGGINL